MDAERFMQHPEQSSMQYEELVRSINNNLRFILEAIKLDRGCVIEEGMKILLRDVHAFGSEMAGKGSE